MSHLHVRLSISMVAVLLVLGCSSNQTITSSAAGSGVLAGQQSNGSQRSGTALYVGNNLFSDDPGRVSVLHIDPQTGASNELAASPFSSMSSIGAFLPVADGKFLLYWNKQFHPQGNSPSPTGPDTSGLYRVHLGASGEFLAPPILITNATNFSTAQNEPSGKYVFVENPSGKAIDVFKVDGNSGELSVQPQLGVSFLQPVQLVSRTGDRLWIDAGNADQQKRTYQAIDIDSASGKLNLDQRQLTFDFNADQLNSGYVATSRQGVFVYQRLTSGQEMYSIFGEQGNGFVKLPVCPADFAQLCSNAEPFLAPAGTLAIFRTAGKLWSVPFSSTDGLQFSKAKSVDIDASLEISNMIFSDDGKLLYGIDSESARTIGFVVDDTGTLTQVPGNGLQVRNGPAGSWVALRLGKTQQ